MQRRLFLLNWFNGKRPGESDVYRRLKSILTQKGLQVECPQNLTRKGVEAVRALVRDGDVLVCHQTRAQGVRHPFDPRDNVAGGARLLKKLSAEFEGDVALTVAAYNAGAASVRRHGGIPAFAETTAYVRNVLQLRDFFERARRGAADPGPAAR